MFFIIRLIFCIVFHLSMKGSLALVTNISIIDTDSTDLNATVNVSDCISPPGEVLGGRIASLTIRGECINIYQNENCTGSFIIIKPGIHAHEKLYQLYYKSWKSKKPQSYGLCDDECSSTNIHTPRPNHLMKVNLQSDGILSWDGNSITLDVKGCTLIPKKMRRKATNANVIEDVCVELHENWDCSGNSIKITKYLPPELTGDFTYWNFNKKAVSASPCGYNCNRTNRTKPKPHGISELHPPSRDENVLILYQEPGFQGESKNFNLKDKKCIQIPVGWKSRETIQSIWTFGKCIEIFASDINCNSSNGKHLRLNDSESDIFKEAHGWIYGIKSIAFCQTETITVNDTNTPNVLSSNAIDWKHLWSYPLTYVILSLFIVITVISAIYIVKLRKSNKRLAMIISQQEIYEFMRGTTLANNTAEPNDNAYVLPQTQPYDKRFEISREYIHFDTNSVLGEGQFGIVYRGRTNPPTLAKECTVAVKAVKPFCDVEYIRAMLKEIKIMIYVGEHPNIVQLVGCHTENLANGTQAELYIMTELCAHGSLLKFLQNYEHSFVNLLEENSSFNLKPIDELGSCKVSEVNLKLINGSHFSFIHLIQWSLQIAQGMDHLSELRVIHGDLAARNVLLDEYFTAKISDFGLSKQLYVDVSYMKKSKVPLPWRGMAIETLRSLQFSIESDIWAYGITLWEIFTLGGLPYPGKVWDESFLGELANGLRPSQPKYATNELYSLMMSCWTENPDLRAPFSELIQKLELSRATHLKNSSDLDFGNTKALIALSSLPPSLCTNKSKTHDYNDVQRRPPSAFSSFLSTFKPRQGTFSAQRRNMLNIRYSKKQEDDQELFDI